MWYIVEYLTLNIFSFIVVFYQGEIQGVNNIYTPRLNSIEPYLEPDYIHQLHMNAKNLLCEVINLMYLHLPRA